MKRFLLALMLVAHEADPCVIVVNSVVLPSSQPAPINTHVWIRNPFRTGAWVLRAVGPVASDIPIATRTWCPQLVEIVPQASLPPSARFELWVIEKDKPYLVASFATGTATDTTAPPKPSFTSAVREVQNSALCGTSESITFAGTPSQDMVAVWTADENGAIPWSAPPNAVFAGNGFDTYRVCQSSGRLTFEKWSKVGLRAMDVAGNLSEPLELDLSKK